MTKSTVDPQELAVAVPAVEHLVDVLRRAAVLVTGVDVPAGAPAGLAGRLTAARVELRRAAEELDDLPDELLRRISAAQVADAPWLTVATWTQPIAGFHAQALVAAEEGLAGSVPARLLRAARIAGPGVTAAGWALTAAQNLSNPYLTPGQKVGRTGVAIAAGTGASLLADAAVGAAIGSSVPVVGTVAGLAAGVAWNVVDTKLHVSARVGDAVASGAKKVFGALGL